MREILFRGKRTDNGDWVYGYFGVFKGITQIYVPFTEEEEKENEGHIFSAIGGLWHTVIPEAIGQYTGLTDKNGKKIFEGDILEVDVREYEEAPDDWLYQSFGSSSCKAYTGRKIKALWSVEYKEHRCRGNCFYVYGKDRRFNTTLTQSTIFNSNPVVIGNIHDNPELLKGGAE